MLNYLLYVDIQSMISFEVSLHVYFQIFKFCLIWINFCLDWIFYIKIHPMIRFWEKLIFYFGFVFVFVFSSENLFQNKYNSTQRPFHVSLSDVKKPKVKSQKSKVKSQKFVNTNFRKILCSIALTWSNGLRVIWSNIDWYVQIMIEYNGNNFFRLFLIGRTMGTLYWRLGVKDSRVR